MIAVDLDPDTVDEIADIVTCAMVADISDPHVLDTLGLHNLDCVIVGVSTNMQVSIMATLLAKEKGAPFVVAKAENEIHKHILEKIGADKEKLEAKRKKLEEKQKELDEIRNKMDEAAA